MSATLKPQKQEYEQWENKATSAQQHTSEKPLVWYLELRAIHEASRVAAHAMSYARATGMPIDVESFV